MADGIAAYLGGILARQGRLPARSFYGESFSALLLGGMGAKYGDSVALLRQRYREMDKEAPNFHWEFNNYAWISLFQKTGDEVAKEFALPLRFRNTRATNWTLLRSCCRHLAASETGHADREARDVLRRFQLRSGLICDERSVRSFQYHCFSAVLCGELYDLGGDLLFNERFRRAAQFIERFVLRTGDTLYVGRGQEQSFGYGALACLLARACRALGEPQYFESLDRCLCLLEGHRRADGSFPLVLNRIEEGFPPSSAASDPRYPGWYAYNNYFDYLPFLGVFLRKAADALNGLCLPPGTSGRLQSRGYRDSDFRVFRSPEYEAVVARPGGGWRGGDGYWTNDLPLPYIVRGSVRLTPSYGGEQFGSKLYSAAGVPLPLIGHRGHWRPLRAGRIWSFFLGDRLVVLSTRGLLVRRFRFLESEVVIDDMQVGWRRVRSCYLFDEAQRIDDCTFKIRGGATVRASVPLELEETREFFWGGALRALVARKPALKCQIRIRLDG
jgi:hypothetical protein